MKRRLRIGVSSCLFGPDPTRTTFDGRPLAYIEQSMSDWLMSHGALPYLIPPPTKRRPISVTIGQLVEEMDGIVLQGGVDVSPTSYGEQPMRPDWSGNRERDVYELALVEEAMKLNRPVLGICRGNQLINVAFGGTLYQDINTQVPGSLVHRNAEIYEKNRHDVDFVPKSSLARWFKTTHATINSVHHQAIKDLADDLVVEARSTEDEIIEAVRLPCDSVTEPWVVGVQWHPEFQDPTDDTLLPTTPLLEAFFRAIRERRLDTD